MATAMAAIGMDHVRDAIKRVVGHVSGKAVILFTNHTPHFHLKRTACGEEGIMFECDSMLNSQFFFH